MNKILILALISVFLLGIAQSSLSKRRLANDDSVESLNSSNDVSSTTANSTTTTNGSSDSNSTNNNSTNTSNETNTTNNSSNTTSNNETNATLNNSNSSNESSNNESNSFSNNASNTSSNNASNGSSNNESNAISNNTSNTTSSNGSNGTSNNTSNTSSNNASNGTSNNGSNTTSNNESNTSSNNASNGTSNNGSNTTSNNGSNTSSNNASNTSSNNASNTTSNNGSNTSSNNASNGTSNNSSNNNSNNSNNDSNTNSNNSTTPVVPVTPVTPVGNNTAGNDTNITTLSVVASVNETTKLANIVVTCSQIPTAVYVAAALVDDVRLISLLPYQTVVSALGNNTVFTDKALYRGYAVVKGASKEASFSLNLKNSGESYQAIGFCVNGNQSSSITTKASWVQPNNGGKTVSVSLTFKKILTDLEVNQQAAQIADVLQVDRSLVYDNFGVKVPSNTPSKRILANETVAPVANNTTANNESNTTYTYNTYIQRDYFNKEDKVFDSVQAQFTAETKSATLEKINEKLTKLNIANASDVIANEFKPRQPIITKPVAKVFDSTSVNVTVSRNSEGRVYILGGNTEENTSLNTYSNLTLLQGTDVKGNKYSLNANAYLRTNDSHVFTFLNLQGNSKYNLIVLATSEGIATDGLFASDNVEFVTGSSFGNKLGMSLIAVVLAIFALAF